VVAEDGGEGDGARDEELGVFEDCGLGVRGCFSVHLVAREDHEIRLLAVEDGEYEFESARVSVAFPTIVTWWFSVTTDAQTCREVQICNLQNLEFTIFADTEGRLLDLGDWSAPNSEMCFGPVARVREQKRLDSEFPTGASFDRVSAEKDVNRCDRLLAV